MKLVEKIKEMNKTADEQNVKNWQEHPRLNNWLVSIWAWIMIFGGTLVIALSLIGYLTKEMTVSQVVAAIAGSITIYIFGMWVLRYRRKIIKKAFLKNIVSTNFG